MNGSSATLPTITALALLAYGPATAQVAPAPQAGLTVYGHGDVEVRPDIAYATVTVSSQSRDQDAAITDVSQRTHAVLAALADSQVGDSDVQTVYYNVEPQYDERVSPPPLTGYLVTNSFRVTLRDVAKIGVILDKATHAGATSISDVQFDLADRSRVEGEALAIAVANARSKADLIAGAAGVELSRIVSIAEGSQTAPEPVRFSSVAVAPLTTDQTQPTPIEPQLIDVTADATLVYSILSSR